MLEKDMEKLETLYTVGGNVKSDVTTVEERQFLKKLNVKLPYDPVFPFLSIHPKEFKAGSGKDTCTRMFIAALATIAKRWKQSKCPLVDEWVSEMLCIHTMEYYSAFKTKL